MTQWYEELFTNYAKTYDNEDVTKGTIQEADFIESEINHDKSKKILDLGFGTGRHAIELTKRGYEITGVDLSESQIERAKEKSEEIFEKFSISERQQEIVNLLLKGKSNREIADILFIAPHTIKNHIYGLYQKLGVKNRYQLVNLFFESLVQSRAANKS